MTPLAFRTLKDLTLPTKDRWLSDSLGSVLPRMSGVHCFDVVAVGTLVEEVRAVALRQDDSASFFDRTAFLPAPRTWIEGDIAEFGRAALHLEESADRKFAQVTLICRPVDPRTNQPARRYTSVPMGRLQLGISGLEVGGLEHLDDDPVWQSRLDEVGISAVESRMSIKSIGAAALAWAACCLAIINSPRIVGRQQHAPHRGLERRLLAKFGAQGKFPIHPWTEIKLDISAPAEVESGAPAEAHLTGQRALHFCRSYLRIRLGQLEIVRSHWRGDASLGIKPARYRLTDQSDAPARPGRRPTIHK